MLSAVSLVKEDGRDGNKTEQNPFTMPEDSIIFNFRETEKARRKQEYQRDQSLSVHEKKTYSGRIKAKQLELRKKLRDGMEKEEEGTTDRSQTELQLPQNASASKMILLKDRNIEKESIREFISKKREMFYIEYAVAVKREEIEQLEQRASREEKKLAKAEKLLEDDVALFDTFLKENDKNSMEAIRIAEQESKAKQEKLAEIRKATAKMVAIKSNISKLEDTLQEYKLYRDFLFKLSPPEWQEKQREKKKSHIKPTSVISKGDQEGKSRETDKGKKTSQSERDTSREKRSPVSRELPPLRDAQVPSRHSMKSNSHSGEISASESDTSEYEEEPELYFTEPQQLLDLLSELEEQNLSLIQNSQETEESLDEFRQTMEQTHKNIEQEANHLKQQIDAMTETIKREKVKTAELELNTRFFDFGKNKAEEECILNCLGQKVKEVYHSCIEDSGANLSTLQMLMAMESRLSDLLGTMELIPPDRLAMAKKAKEKERRLRLRDEKLTLQKQHQEERIKKAMERAQAEIKRTAGKKLMPRSQPPVRKLKNKDQSDITDEEREKYLYFFT
ncbi:cilia- and flagella-associated protein 100 isoform 2-T2 [Clarias gariepinus]|uniref:cilia- and flagella-associated protein 100 isoform X2 n=1 Tax=Clarias gariepinus TaxID=13013 RepID=UPI00234C8EA3|nr:cilia- and flagella-associated protein 100 isoform X2 [Clarias gariepinus]